MNSSNEDVMNMKLILAGRDAVAVDSVAALVMNWDPHSVKYLKMLQNSGIGNLDTSRITVAGKRVDQVRKDFNTIKIAPAGGASIKDRLSPKFTLKKLELSPNNMNLSLDIDEKAIKVEVYIDGKLNENIITSKLNDIKINLKGINAGRHVLEILAYDRFLNNSMQNFTFNV